eukprot:scaffold794_cov151-Skeletonema_marinoi.AAC.7
MKYYMRAVGTRWFRERFWEGIRQASHESKRRRDVLRQVDDLVERRSVSELQSSSGSFGVFESLYMTHCDRNGTMVRTVISPKLM